MIEWSEWSKQHTWHYIHDHLEIKFQKASEYIHASLDDKWMNDFFFWYCVFFKKIRYTERNIISTKKIVLNLSEFECWWSLSKRKKQNTYIVSKFSTKLSSFFFVVIHYVRWHSFYLFFLYSKSSIFLIIEELDSFDSFWCIAKRQK